MPRKELCAEIRLSSSFEGLYQSEYPACVRFAHICAGIVVVEQAASI